MGKKKIVFAKHMQVQKIKREFCGGIEPDSSHSLTLNGNNTTAFPFI